MRKACGCCITILAILTCLPAVAREVRQYSIEEFINTTSISGASFSSDGQRILVTSDETGIPNVFSIPIDGGERVQLTHSETDPIYLRSCFPNDDRVIYASDQGGNELTKLFVRELDGSITSLTREKDAKADFFGWAKDEKSFFVTSNARDPKYFDVYEVQADGYASELIYENREGYNPAAISANKRYIALVKMETRDHSRAFLYDRNLGTMQELLPTEEEAVRSPETFAEDGKSLYLLTDIDHEFRYLVKYNLETGESRVVEKLNWDVQYAGLSRDGKYLVVGLNIDARADVKVYDTATGERVSLPKPVGGGIASIRFANDENAVAFYEQSGRTPGDLYYYHLRQVGAPLRLTNRLNPAIDADDLVEPEVVRFASYDGTTIPGILYRPHQADAENRAPALVYVHGGPGGQTTASYNPLIQYLVNHGYVVYGINNRGSSGYGKTFYGMDDRKHGSADLDDCVASKQMLIDTGYVDPNRIGIIGGSYGGYMVCAALAFRPEEFEVGVNIFGVTNWVRTLKSIPSWWEASRNALYKELGDPFTQEDYLTSISPLFHAGNIVKPMIVLQGKNDPRVLQVESDEMVAAVRANEVPVEYVVFDDEGHGFRKKDNQITGYRAVMRFLDTHLKQDGVN